MRADIVGISFAAVAAVVTKNIFLGSLYYICTKVFFYSTLLTLISVN